MAAEKEEGITEREWERSVPSWLWRESLHHVAKHVPPRNLPTALHQIRKKPNVWLTETTIGDVT